MPTEGILCRRLAEPVLTEEERAEKMRRAEELRRQHEEEVQREIERSEALLPLNGEDLWSTKD